jgi:hypothetical protein
MYANKQLKNDIENQNDNDNNNNNENNANDEQRQKGRKQKDRRQKLKNTTVRDRPKDIERQKKNRFNKVTKARMHAINPPKNDIQRIQRKRRIQNSPENENIPKNENEKPNFNPFNKYLKANVLRILNLPMNATKSQIRKKYIKETAKMRPNNSSDRKKDLKRVFEFLKYKKYIQK